MTFNKIRSQNSKIVNRRQLDPWTCRQAHFQKRQLNNKRIVVYRDMIELGENSTERQFNKCQLNKNNLT